ncbi:TMEM43 family protein [Legionella hackeliae]|uniref:Transmembrane protein n=1 Tax=Legionella hackeliae TaxID=449 RepID=A0A0A8UKT4_LEGHA|nr:TMEM43 family protein [Legionella hackeliae]KTD13503.1 hypothetical protein Lhac_0887 [Legionella hackeliae]CEK09348.1 conserved membrane protein of unknown function [Legionella hackeliae]STX49254.1 Protein of uncharacterised function (DUF1625) [Legionella hackeliae]
MSEEIVTKSWGSRIKDAFIGILGGIVLIIGAIVLAFWNERHGLHTAESLVEAQRSLISVPNSPIDPKNNLHVVYLSGLATTKDILTDPALGVSQNAIGLHRKVEMYQWKQNQETKTESQLGGSEKQVTTYSYKKVWTTRLLDSSGYKDQAGHENPAAMPIESKQWYAEKVTIGDFLLPFDLVTQISDTQSVDLEKVNTASLQNKINKPVRYINNQLYGGKDYQNPEIGDIRVSLIATLPQTVSVIGQQTGNTLQAYMAKAGQPVLLLVSGQQSPEQMIQDALTENRLITWLLRGVTLLMLVVGFSLLLKPIVVLADVIPILGSIAGFGTGLIAFICGFVLWTLVTALAWFAIRPWWSAGLLVICFGIIYFLYKRRKTQQLAVKPNASEN